MSNQRAFQHTFHIQQDDYNTYVVNDRLYTRFSDIGKEDHR